MFKIIAVYSTLVFILCLCLGCEKSKEIKEKLIEPKCISGQSDCFIKSASGDFSILFNYEPVITETPFDISLISHTQHTIKNISAHMEGKNMFMGKVPLFFQDQLTDSNLSDSGLSQINIVQPNSKQQDKIQSASAKVISSEVEIAKLEASTVKKYYVADTMLGSCSEENMRWIIYFKIDLEKAGGEAITEHFTVEFDSLRG